MKAKIISSIRAKLAPGFYAASSDSQAYYYAKARLLNRKSGYKKMGETALPYGMKGVYFQVTTGGGMRSARNPGPELGEEIGTTEMRMGDEDYSSVRREYQAWGVKWWREVIQNAVDAGASNIALASVQQSDGTWLVSCEDDGKGMDQTTFTDVFLVLKASTKRGDGGRNLGGFGEAKKLIVLPWIKWRISSRDRVYEGVGKNAKIYAAAPRRGTRVEVVMGAGYDEHTSGSQAEEVLSKSNYPYVNFTVNGTRVKANFRPTEEVLRIGDKAVVYFVAGDSESMYYYVTARDSQNNGVLYMFSKWLGSETMGGSLVVELTGPSKEILTANRDGFRDQDIEREILSFVRKASVDTSSAFKEKNNLVERVYQGVGKFKVERTNERLMDLSSEMNPLKKASGKGEAYEINTQLIERIITALKDANSEENSEIGVVSPDSVRDYLDTRVTGTEHFENAMRLISWRPDFFTINTIPGFVMPPALDPVTMKPRVRKIAKVWAELVRFALIQLDYSGEYGIGWIFSRSNPARGTGRTAAAYKQMKGQKWIVLNPFLDNEHEEMYQASRMDHLETLYALAIHETTHMVSGISEHNEDFSSALTTNMARCAKGFRKLHSIVASIRMKGDIEL